MKQPLNPEPRTLTPINYNSVKEIKDLLANESLGMQKKFGQNFLINPAIRQALVTALNIKENDEVWEIGPGLGAMTTLLLEQGCKVKAFEIDTGFIRMLKELFKDNKNFSLTEGDVLKTWSTQEPASFLLGNLPYNIAATLIADMTEKGQIFSRMVITVQKEVALRMSAKPGSKDYSSFSVLCASAYNVKPLMTIGPSSFYPKPNVDSMGVLLEAKQVAEPYPKVMYPLIRALFVSRRKTIKNNLTAFLSSVPPYSLRSFRSQNVRCARLFSENNLTGSERAEALDLNQFISLAKSIENMSLYKGVSKG